MRSSMRCLYRAALVRQPTSVADQAAIAHPVDQGGKLRGGQVVDPSELLRAACRCRAQRGRELRGRRYPRPSGPRYGRHRGARGAVQRRGTGGPHLVGHGGRAQGGVHRPTLERCAGRSREQQVGGASERGESITSPRIRRNAVTQPSWRAAIAASGVVVLQTFGMWRATSPGSEVVEERVHHLRRD